jgi:predicted nucleic-acid-binding Zn-ribbon protein
MSELKNCPFCGGYAEIITGVSNSVPKLPTARIRCVKCYCTTDTFVDVRSNGEDIQKATEIWNSRFTETTSENTEEDKVVDSTSEADA